MNMNMRLSRWTRRVKQAQWYILNHPKAEHYWEGVPRVFWTAELYVPGRIGLP